MDKFNIRLYLDQLSDAALKILTSDGLYNNEAIVLDQYGYVNTAIIHKALQDHLNFHIKTYDKEDRKNLYVPVVLAIVINGFIKNYIDYHPEPRVGEIIQKDRVRYTVLRIADKILIGNQANGNCLIEISRNVYEKFIITTATKETTGRKLKVGFEHYRNFFNKIIQGGLGEKMPSKFKHKYLIITSKDVYDVIRLESINGEKIYKSLPIRYIAKSGKETDNLPIDSMVYITNDYETASEFVLGRYDIETIVIVGASKYRDYVPKISGDIRAERVQNVIFVGCEPINTFKNLHCWNWTKCEMTAYQDVYQPHIEIAESSPVSNKMYNFQNVVEEIEKEYELSLLKYFSDNLWKISRTIIPNIDSRLCNKLQIIKEEFKNKVIDLIGELFEEYGYDDTEIVANKIIDSFNEIINSVNLDKWAKFQTVFKNGYVVVPSDCIDEIRTELKNTKCKVVLYSELNKLHPKQPVNVCFFSVYGKEHFERTYLSDKFKSTFILYPHEFGYYEKLLNQFNTEEKAELCGPERTELLGVKYKFSKNEEDFDDKINRFLQVLTDISEKDNENRLEDGEDTHILCRIEFEDGTIAEVDSNSSVLFCSDKKAKVTTADQLKVGDIIRIYENLHKDKLWKLALERDREGVFQQINESSKFWKRCLLKFRDKKNLTIEQLFKLFYNNGLYKIKNATSIERWLQEDSDLKFPASDRNMRVIKRTIQDSDLDLRFEDILKTKRLYRRIMISLGRDLSNEIAQYILSDGLEIGINLSKFDDNIRRGIAQSNAPIRKIKNIAYVQYEYEE